MGLASDQSRAVEAVAAIDAVPGILDVVCSVTGLRFAAIARVTDDSWTCCAVRDDLDFGLEPGGELELATTICDEIRCSREAVVIDNVAEDPRFRDHPTPVMYGFQSYISIPIILSNGEFFGTLCALDPRPARLSDPTVVKTVTLFAELISLHLESGDRLSRAQAALLDEQQTAELRDHFIAVLGHDLRNPLAAVEAGVGLLSKMNLDGRAGRIVERMQQSCNRMGALIGDVLDFARGKLGGGIPLHRVVVDDLGRQLEEVIAEMRAVHTGRRIEADIRVERSLFCDAARLAQLLSNLLSNALTHGDPDAPVEVSARADEAILTIAVTNRGATIPSDKMSRLFRPFWRGEGETTSQGLGLGLYISSQIAKAHGGTIHVVSEDGRTCFTLVAPIEPTADGKGEDAPARIEEAVSAE